MSRRRIVLYRCEARLRFAWLPTRITAGALAGRMVWLDHYHEFPDSIWAPVRAYEACPDLYVDGRSIIWDTES